MELCLRGKHDPQIAEYYNPDIPMRKMPETDLELTEAAKALADIMPDHAGLRLLVTASTASLFLPFLPDEGYKPDRLLIVYPDSERMRKLQRSASRIRIISARQRVR